MAPYQSERAGFFGMALDAEHVVRFKDCGVGGRVGAGSRSLRDHRNVVAVGEVNMWMRRQTFEDTRRFDCVKMVPAHVRDAGCVVEASDHAGKYGEALLVRGFLAAFEERLEAEADSEERDAAMNAVEERLTDLQVVEGLQHLSEVAYAGENELVRLLDAFGVSHEGVRGAEFVEGILDGAEVSCSVVEDVNHSNPLVEGSWSFRRASLEQA
jgi:hypothetical protein